MARYRPPQPPSSPYITRVGYERLRQESEQLWTRRREVVVALSAAAAEGDRSENAEYIYRKKELRELDRRIRYLQIRLPKLKVVDVQPSDPDRIFFGAWVTLENEAGEETRCRIVGADEFDPKRHWISVDSPMSKALLKRTLDEEVEVQTPLGKVHYWVVDIAYHPEDSDDLLPDLT
ncbi:MAG: transcription elongation factor GreB [Gammaproteobacteria bacterium RIFOXYA12_FULL_61_12]|nr:MAG: transcription elongation factor GreB [Gammaproteobacteria bacterium RIFOXYD12_FULL_61_37]OGT91237.1 MAG: transcription elongation factor GreB [Gammaproteobacteria bacterium RIFOXYA12_FULL_61_12]